MGPQPLLEDHVLDRIENWLETASAQHLIVLAGYIDQQLVSILPVAYQSRVAQLIERKDPKVLARMPTLQSRQTHLTHAMELARIFRSGNLNALLAAIEDEKRRGSDLV